MKDFLKIIGIFLLFGAVVAGVSAFTAAQVAREVAQSAPLGSTDVNPLRSATTPQETTVGTSSTLITATSSSRQYLGIVNDGDTAVYLNFGNAAQLGKGIRLNANGGSYEINGNNLFMGAVYGIATSTPSDVSFIEYK